VFLVTYLNQVKFCQDMQLKKHQLRPAGSQTPGGRQAGRGLAARRGYRYDPITTRDTLLISRI
jgi:hypothetical protein